MGQTEKAVSGFLFQVRAEERKEKGVGRSVISWSWFADREKREKRTIITLALLTCRCSEIIICGRKEKEGERFGEHSPLMLSSSQEEKSSFTYQI